MTARLSWRQRGARSELSLSSPLGVGGVDIELDDELGDKLEQALGIEVPEKSLKYWLLGVPDPGLPVEGLSFEGQDLATQGLSDEQRLPRLLQQAGWQIEFRRYSAVPRTDLVMPSRIDLRRDGLEVRVVVDAWGGAK